MISPRVPKDLAWRAKKKVRTRRRKARKGKREPRTKLFDRVRERNTIIREPHIVIIVGPTAVGKTAAAIRLAQSARTSIISADSRQCYRELNIGVAKPSPSDLKTVHHYFIDSHTIREEVNAAVFEKLALHWTAEILRE